MKPMGITVFSCGQDEREMFRALAPRYDIVPAATGEPVSPSSIAQAGANLCVSVGHKTAVTEETLAALHRAGVRYVSARSAGTDHIDLQAAHRMGITVGNVAYSPGSVADYTLMLMLMALRSAKPVIIGAAAYDFRTGPVRGRELCGMTVGVVGAGRIGRAVMQRLHGFGCRVLVHDKTQRPEHVPLHTLLAQSDIVTLHAPLTPETRHMLSDAQLRCMKRDAVLVNTARGALVDTAALVHALESGTLGGAALDVLEGEEGIFYFDCSQKPVDHALLLRLQAMPNVIITPHTAYYTGRALYDTVEDTMLHCRAFERKHKYA